jgi:hypothetical protein
MNAQPHPDGVRLLPWAIPDWLIDATLIVFAIAGFFGRPFVDNS